MFATGLRRNMLFEGSSSTPGGNALCRSTDSIRRWTVCGPRNLLTVALLPGILQLSCAFEGDCRRHIRRFMVSHLALFLPSQTVDALLPHQAARRAYEGCPRKDVASSSQAKLAV